MTVLDAPRRTSIAKQVAVVFALLVALSWTVPAFAPAYYSHALTSMVRNGYANWIDYGVFYFGIVAIGFLLQAVVVVGAIRLLDALYRRARDAVAAA